MEIDLSTADGVLVATLRVHGETPERFDFSSFLTLGRDADHLLVPLLAELRLLRAKTARHKLRMLAQFGEALRASACRALPTTNEGWQALILEIHRFIHTRTDRRQTLYTRHINVWKTTRRWFGILIDRGIVPATVHVPSVYMDLVTGNLTEQLLGQGPHQTVDGSTDVNKLLMPISLARTDAAYLDEVRDTLIARRQTLFGCLKDYWDKLRANLEFGLLLRRSLTDEQLAELTADSAQGMQCIFAPGDSVEALATFLTLLERNWGGKCRKPSALGQTPFQKGMREHPKNWPIASALPDWSGTGGSKSCYALTWTWLGRLSQRDIAVIIALLIMLHPKWTPSALAEATVLDRAGKSYLDLDGDSLSFEVKKHRAKAMKRETLCPLSEEILTTILSFSSELREQLSAVDHPFAGRLFLPWGEREEFNVSPPEQTLARFLTGRESFTRRNKWLGDLYPELEGVGLTPGTISFKKIRATEGVLEWFRTKSLDSAARRMGNSTRVALEHYIPKALLHAWMTRAARRFQNLWIAVAAADEPFLLDVTDFSSVGDLNAFIADLLQSHGATSSPLGAELHRCYGAAAGSQAEDHDGTLHVTLNPLSLSALYCYQAAALAAAVADDVLAKVDVVSGSSPKAFIQLADMLQVQLPRDRNMEYRRLHAIALESASNPNRIQAWGALFS